MSSEQQIFPFGVEQPLVKALNKIKGGLPKSYRYDRFIAELATAAFTSAAGSTIIASIPPGLPGHQVHESLCGQLTDAGNRGIRDKQESISFIEIPIASNSRMCRAIAASYLAGPVLGIGPTQNAHYFLDFGHCPVPGTEMHRVSSVIGLRTPSFYIVNGGQKLAQVGGNIFDPINHLRFLIQVAQHSQRTHIILANAQTVSQWLIHSEIADAATAIHLYPYPCVARPAEETKESVMSNPGFYLLLDGLDLFLPLKQGESLQEREKDIYPRVWGCPYRLNKWVQAALRRAINDKAEELCWSHFEFTAPSNSEATSALEEYKVIHNIPEITELEGMEGGAPKPFHRTLGRDPAAKIA